MIYRLAGLVLAVLAVAACGASGGSSAAPASSSGAPNATMAPATTAPEGSGVASPAGAASTYCSIFTLDEVKAILGADVNAGEDAALGTGCQWNDGDGGALMQIQVIDDPTYFVAETGAEGYEELSGIGVAAFSVPGLVDGEWSASAQTANGTYYVTVRSSTTTVTTAVDLLTELIKRR
ncbi:MAG TPA: hypothetical protein VES19_01825 [Candidatus Limnocylindrales bacterium]|nr:hypothetical protein [Candidatus Limnocylindrales bacterium]